MTQHPESRQFTPAQVIETLAEQHGLLHPDGSVNYSAFGRRTGIPVSTISRIHRGQRDANTMPKESWVLSTETIQRIMQAFHLSFAEASGQVAIGATSATKRRYEPSTADLELLRQLRSLSASAQREVQALVDIKSQLEAASSKPRPVRKRAASIVKPE